MRRGFVAVLIGLLGTAALARAELPPPVLPAQDAPPPEVVGPEEVFWSAPPLPGSEPCPACHEQVWFTADYLLWWLRRPTVQAPLVTTGSPLDAVPGAIDQGGTSVLSGNQSLKEGTFSGVRLGVGFTLVEGWFLEGSYFALERRAAGSTFTSDANGNPVLARPYFDNQAAANAAYLDALPGVLTGSVAVSARTQLQGYEVNLATNLVRLPIQDLPDGGASSITLGVLAGFRTVELHESLVITDNVTALAPGVLTFVGGPADPPNSLTISDRFRNYNHFYGGQVGGWARWQSGSLDAALAGKVALGTTQQLAITDGSTTMNTPGATPTVNAGGILVQPSNTGRYYRTSFGFVPEMAFDLGYWLTPLVRLSVGYHFLYWNRVARPGDEIDTTVNPAQVPRDPRFGNGLGDNRPVFQFHSSDFWAMGLNFSVLVQY
jgi:hypothetical protein